MNGAGKWKVQQLLQNEQFRMTEKQGILPSVNVQTATKESRTWAENVDMKEIVERWRDLNAWRYRVTALAVVLSAVATCCYNTKSMQ